MFNERLLKISLAVIALLVIIGFISINFIMNSDDSTKPMYTSSPIVTKPNNISTDPKEVNLETIIINIRADKYKLLKVDIAFVMKNANDKKVLLSNVNNVRNVILQYLSSMDANKLNTEKGKDQLKEELIDIMEESFGYKIETVYFKNFLLAL